MFEHECRQIATDIRKASDRLRELARHAAPGVWQAVDDVGAVRLTGRDDVEVAVLTGKWAPSTAHYLTMFAPDTAFRMAELMWRSQSVIRKGEMPSHIQSALVALAQVVPDS